MARSRKVSPRIRALGAELREHRENAGLTVREVAERLGGHHSKYARYETGDQTPAPETITALLTAYGLPEGERERLATSAREATETANSVKPRRSNVDADLKTLLELERTATSIVDVAPMLVPGPMQTADYARAVMSGWVAADDVEAHVAMRIGRREVLTRRDAPHVTAIIGEWALREPIGLPGVMAEQLRQLADIAERPNVDLRVLLSARGAWTPAHVGQFLLFEFDKADPVVHVETLSSDAFLSSPGDVHVHREAARWLRETALPTDESAELLDKLTAEMEESS
ncbi:helix-turn-helix domain-containing protein [Salinifilum ghardaiensis]